MPTTRCDKCSPPRVVPDEHVAEHLVVEHGISLDDIANAPVDDLTDEPAEQPGRGTLRIFGDPNDKTFELKLGDLDLLGDGAIYVRKAELVLTAGEVARAYITVDVRLVDVDLPATVEVASETHNLLRRLGWTPPPPEIPPHEVVHVQRGTCVLYVGPHTVCGARPDDPIHVARDGS